MIKFFGSKEIKNFVLRFIQDNKASLKDKVVIDLPAGTGITTRALWEAGARAEAYDLFPEFFKVEGKSCAFCNLEKGIPLSEGYADWVFCQEGMEHMPDQLKTFSEFNRILKPGGTLVLTTPNYSNLKAKLSYLLTESEYFHKIMPPNEIDDVWYSEKNREERYYGHLFLTGIQRLRVLAVLNGFKIKKLHFTRANGISVFLLILLYPWILLSNWITLKKALRKKGKQAESAQKTYLEQFKLNTHPGILLSTHLFVEFEKTGTASETDFSETSKLKGTDFIT